MIPAARADARPQARVLGAATLGLALAALALARPAPERDRTRRAPSARTPAADALAGRGRRQARASAGSGTRAGAPDLSAHPDNARPARQLYGAAAMLAASVLSDSAVEHYRGQFENPGMFAPLASAAVLLVCAARGAAAPTGAAADAQRRAVPRAIGAALPYATACAVGTAGLGFHAYNVFRRPGGLSWGNLFYAAPLGAPAALTLAGLIGLAAGRVARGATTLAGVPAGRALGALSAAGLAGTSAEAALLHFRGAYHNPAMWIPVTLPPVAAGLLAQASLDSTARPPRLARLWLSACTWLGAAGVAFHARGIARQMGGWRNWSQNVLAGPPLPAPPSFSALALAGQAALTLHLRHAAREAA